MSISLFEHLSWDPSVGSPETATVKGRQASTTFWKDIKHTMCYEEKESRQREQRVMNKEGPWYTKDK
jgi:hypothetical protein